MSALGADGHAVAVRADRARHDAAQVRTVEGVKFADAAAVVLYDPAAALQVAEPLLTGVRHEQKAAFCPQLPLHEVARADHHHGEICRIVADAGRVHLLFILAEGHRLGVREDRVGVRHEDDQIILVRHLIPAHDVQRLIDLHIFKAVGPEPRFAVFRALFLVVRGRGDGAQVPDDPLDILDIFRNIRKHFLCQHHFFPPLYSRTVPVPSLPISIFVP